VPLNDGDRRYARYNRMIMEKHRPEARGFGIDDKQENGHRVLITRNATAPPSSRQATAVRGMAMHCSRERDPPCLLTPPGTAEGGNKHCAFFLPYREREEISALYRWHPPATKGLLLRYRKITDQVGKG